MQFAIPGTRRRGSFPFGLDLRGRELCSLLGVLHGDFIVFLEVLQLALLVIELDFRGGIDLEVPVFAILVAEDKLHLIRGDLLDLSFDLFGRLGLTQGQRRIGG